MILGYLLAVDKQVSIRAGQLTDKCKVSAIPADS
jgi:hypothetical protein